MKTQKGDTPYKMEVYSLSGEKIMSKEIEMNLDHVKFAGKNVLMYDDVTCELISLKGVVKFKHVFTKTVRRDSSYGKYKYIFAYDKK